MGRKIENRRRCGICIINVQRASFAKYLESKKNFEIETQEEMNIPEWLFKESIENEIRKCNPKTLKQTAIRKIRIDDEKLKRELAKKMIHLYHFGKLRIEFVINLDSNYINHANSRKISEPLFPEFGKEIRYI